MKRGDRARPQRVKAQVAIALASVFIIIGFAVLVWIAGALGDFSVAFSSIAFSGPTALHLF